MKLYKAFHNCKPKAETSVFGGSAPSLLKTEKDTFKILLPYAETLVCHRYFQKSLVTVSGDHCLPRGNRYLRSSAGKLQGICQKLFHDK